MARWFLASNYTPADDNSIQAVPNPGAYTDIDDGDRCFVHNNGQTDVFIYDASSATSQNIPHVITPDGNAGNGRWLRKEFSLEHKNGFDTASGIGPQLDSLATIGVAGTTFTLTYVADYSFWVQGAKYTVTSGNKTVEITDVEGLHWIYFDNTGTLQIQAPGGSTDDLILENCLVAAAHWDATNNACILLFDERHGANMSPVTHYHLHETLGAQWESGLGLSAFSVSGDGTAAAHAQFDLGSGEFHDEDNEISIAADADATIDTFYRLGVGGAWRKISATAGYPVCDPQTGTRMDWNDYNGGTWQLAEVANNDYVLTHYFATNDSLGGGVIGLMGQADYATLPAAQAGAETELNSLLLGTMPLPEILPIATVIWRTTNGSTNQVAGAIMPVSGGGDYIDWRTSDVTGVGVVVTDHESLGGLLGGAVGDHYHFTGAQHTDLTDGGETTLHDHTQLTESDVPKLKTISTGVEVLDDVIPVINFQNLAQTVKYGSLYHDLTELQLKNWISGGEIEIYGFNTGNFGRWLAKFDPDLGVSLYDASNVQQLITRDGYADAPVGLKIGGSTVTLDNALDEDDMTSDSATAVATQQSIKAYVRDNAGDPALPKLDFYQDWLQETKYQNASVLTCVVSGTLIDTTTMDHNIEEKRYDFTAAETLQTDDLYDSNASLTNITECIIDADITDSVAGTLQVSNNGGSNWITVTDTTQVVTFVTTGIDLVLKYTAGGTGYINHMGVLYNPDTIYAPATEVIVPGDNIIINGDMRIAQRGTSFASPTSADYLLDRWVQYDNSAGAITWTQDTDVPTVAQSGHNSETSLKMDVTTADAAVAADAYGYLTYVVEGYDFAPIESQYATLSFWIKSHKTGTMCVSFQNSAGTETYVSEVTISVANTWEYKEITVNFNSGSTFLYTNGIGLYINFAYHVGSDFQGAADTWLGTGDTITSNQSNFLDSTDNNIWFAQVKLEKGQVATPWKARLYEDEFALCQRYYMTEDGFETIASVYNASYIQSASHTWLVTMRDTPTVTLANVSWLPGSGGGWGTIGAIYSNVRTAQMHGFIYNTVAGTLGYSGKVTYDWEADAEL